MPTPTLIALKHPGEMLTMRVASCTKVPVGKYPEFEFVGVATDGVLSALRISKQPMERQLNRLDLTTDTVVGQVLRFGRSENASDASKPYWDIDFSDAAIPAPRGGPAAAPAAARATTPAKAAPATKTEAVEHGGHIPGLDDDPPPPDDASAPTNATAVSPAAPGPTAKEKLASIYKLQEACFKHALDLADLAKERGVAITLEGVSAITAQAMIEFNRRNY